MATSSQHTCSIPPLSDGLLAVLRALARAYIQHPGRGLTLQQVSELFAPDPTDSADGAHESQLSQARIALWFLQRQELVKKKTGHVPPTFVPVSRKDQTIADILPDLKARTSKPKLSQTAGHVLYRLFHEGPLVVNFIDPSYGAHYNEELEHRLYYEGLLVRKEDGKASLTEYGKRIAQGLPETFSTHRPRGRARTANGRTPAQISRDWRAKQKKILDHQCQQDLCPKLEPLFNEYGPLMLKRAIRVLKKSAVKKRLEEENLRRELDASKVK